MILRKGVPEKTNSKMLLFFLISILFSSSVMQAQIIGQHLRAVDDAATTGPRQSVRINVVANDTVSCANFSWNATLPAGTDGVIDKQGDFLIFTPGTTCRNTTVSIPYTLRCGSSNNSVAKIVITVTEYNYPVNVLPKDVKCWDPFPSNVGFDVENKFLSDGVTPKHSKSLLVYSLPIVGDLNGDRKPEILAIGISSYDWRFTASAQYITILDGQTGKTLVEYDAGFTFAVSSDVPNRSAYHSSPSYMAIADVDNDGKGEIIMAFPGSTKMTSSNTPNLEPDNGRVIAYKVVTNSANEITGLQQYWKAVIGYKAPRDDTQHLSYDVPAPYIADLNGDGIPEVIVYNKIYNAQTGRLLMAWDGPAAVAKNSSLATLATSGLLDYENSAIYTDLTTSNTVYDRAFVGRRPSTTTGYDYVWVDDYIAVFAVENMDGDEDLEVVAGNRIYNFRFNYLGKDGETGDHTANIYTTVEGPRSVILPTTSGNLTYYLSDGFTRVADVDGDGLLDVINISEVATDGSWGSRPVGLITVWDPRFPNDIKAASAFYGGGGDQAHIPAFGIPFVGDINGKIDGGWDGTQFTKKLPEIGLLTSNLYINMADKRNGITFHPLSSDENLRKGVGWNNNSTSGHFNQIVSGTQGHIFAVTYCDSAGVVPYHRRLKLSWAMEHKDRSSNTGLTIFDFNNDGAKDLVYRDEATLRVISPKKKDYVPVSETAGSSVMFSTAVTSLTGYEAPTIADVNMDASADIVVTRSHYDNFTEGRIEVYQYKKGTSKWAPAPPVWNQAYYNPRHIGEDLRVPARPTPMLATTYTDADGATIYPYNGTWEQLNYVRDGTSKTPVVRNPDAELLDMVVVEVNTTANTTTIDLVIHNLGSASIPANTPVAFYNGGTNLDSIDQSPQIGAPLPVGMDIFPSESVRRTFTLTSFNGTGRLIWARILNSGFTDCDSTNNTASGGYCPGVEYKIMPEGDVEICENDSRTLTATPVHTPNPPVTYQWFWNNRMIDGAVNQTYTPSSSGEYVCFVREGNICTRYTQAVTMIVHPMEERHYHAVVIRGLPAYIPVLANDVIPSTCTPNLKIESDPDHGTATVVDNRSIIYTPDASYTGAYEIVYSLKDDGATATIYLQVVEAPDNIHDVTCLVSAPSAPWAIREVPINLHDTIDNYGPLTVGDIDGDGRVEVLAYKPYLPAGGATGDIHKRMGMKMFYYHNDRMELKGAFDFKDKNNDPFPSSAMGAPAIARYNDEGYIVVLNNDDFHLYAFKEDGTCRWKSGSVATDSEHATMIGIADFNADGIPEVYTGNRIFSLPTGALLCDGDDDGQGGDLNNNKGILLTKAGYSSMAADMDGDGIPELCAGTQIYKVEIPAGATGDGEGSIFVIEDLQLNASLLPANAGKDGATQVADIDNDGQPEVVVFSLKNGYVEAYVWKPLPDNRSYLIGSYAVSFVTPGSDHYYGIPMIGNIDDDPYPEIVFISDTRPDKIRALRYNPSAVRGLQIGLKWELSESDQSGCTGMSLFDFNQDGVNEIVYRNETTLRIINGNSSSPVALGTFHNVTSGTLREMPVIADIDGDGQAEIIVSGGRGAEAGSGAASEKYNGYLRVFKSNGAPWAPARRVWNQYAYNAVNINDDLTVPQHLISLGSLFPAAGNVFGDGNDVRPYNAFLQQQTTLNRYGSPLFPAPHGKIVGKPVFHYDAGNDSLAIALVITNTGEAGFQPPLYVTAYKNAGDPGNKIATDSILSLVNAGDTVAFTLSIPGFSRHLPMDKIEIRLNDKGECLQVQSECGVPEGTFTSGSLLMANNDLVSIFKNHSAEIALLANDSIPASCGALSVAVIGGPLHGTLSPGSDDTLRYTPFADYLGPDTVIYRLACGGNTATALVKIAVSSIPDNIDSADCYASRGGSIGTLALKAQSDTTVYWLATPFVGDLDNDGIPEVVAPGVAVGGNGDANMIRIFDDKLKLKTAIPLPSPLMMPEYNTMTFLIADVDNDLYGEIVFCTTDRFVYCYKHDGTQLWMSNDTYGGINGTDTCPSPIVADIDGDGYAEILVGDKLFAGESGHALLTLPAGGRGYSEGSPHSYMPVFADVDNDGIMEIAAGKTVYKATIADRSFSPTGNVATVLASAPAGLPDGFTSVADVDLDGDPDVIVTGAGAGTTESIMYVWDGATSAQIGNTVTVTATSGKSISRPSAGNIRGNDSVDIVFTYQKSLVAYRYNSSTNTFVRLFLFPTDDNSGATAVSLFDFDQDGAAELVHRDMSRLRIIKGNGTVLTSDACYSYTHTEYPVIVDLDRDGHADILVSGNTTALSNTDVRILRYGSDNAGNWAPARPVWNQYGYHPLHINDRLSVPRFPLRPSALFPGDVRPYNHFLQQQTTLDFDGVPYRPLPDAVPLASESKIEVAGAALNAVVAVYNRGSEALSAPIYVTFYNGAVSSSILGKASLDKTLLPGDTAVVSFTGSISPSIVQIVARVNDDGATFPFAPECKDDNNELIHTDAGRYMKKDASIGNVPGNGYYGNPVAVLYNEKIQYRITARNINASAGDIDITDTLPAYLNYVDGSASPSLASGFPAKTNNTTPPRDVLKWQLSAIPSMKDTVVSYRATPAPDVCASQPLFINRAWIKTGNMTVATDSSTYHQGAGASLVTFSAGRGGSVYNAHPQVVDYRTSPGEGILAVPDEGYVFAGWSHDEYHSLRGERVAARSGILHYDTLPILGNVELTARFDLIRYPIRYYLNGGEIAGNGNPAEYTVRSGALTLEEPLKAGDEFIGWTGSNGATPRKTVTIPEGSTGELEFYANYLYSGREDPSVQPETDRIWSADDELYIRTSRAGSIVRVYTSDGRLTALHTILSSGVTKIKLHRGLYIVTLNNGAAQKVVIN